MASLATSVSLSSIPLKTLYARLLLTRLVDERLQMLCTQGYLDTYSSCRGYEAAQVSSAMSIEVGRDFTLPSFRDLGVVLTVGMTPYEVIHTCLSASLPIEGRDKSPTTKQQLQWSYHKRNVVHVNTSTATHILHAAGIAFAAKLRKAAVVTIAYCSDSTVSEPDFLEGIRFAALQQLPVVFVCEQSCSTLNSLQATSCFNSLPEGLTHQRIDGKDIVQVYQAMQAVVQQIRAGSGPVLLELAISDTHSTLEYDALIQCEHILREQQLWDEQWATALHAHLNNEVEQAVLNVLLDTELSRQ